MPPQYSETLVCSSRWHSALLNLSFGEEFHCWQFLFLHWIARDICIIGQLKKSLAATWKTNFVELEPMTTFVWCYVYKALFARVAEEKKEMRIRCTVVISVNEVFWPVPLPGLSTISVVTHNSTMLNTVLASLNCCSLHSWINTELKAVRYKKAFALYNMETTACYFWVMSSHISSVLVQQSAYNIKDWHIIKWEASLQNSSPEHRHN